MKRGKNMAKKYIPTLRTVNCAEVPYSAKISACPTKRMQGIVNKRAMKTHSFLIIQSVKIQVKKLDTPTMIVVTNIICSASSKSKLYLLYKRVLAT